MKDQLSRSQGQAQAPTSKGTEGHTCKTPEQQEKGTREYEYERTYEMGEEKKEEEDKENKPYLRQSGRHWRRG
jgi:hypothetical protein